MLTAPQLSRYYPDLRDPRFESRLAVVHSRFSTNTFPSWELAHPYRMLAHNGEINTLRGNRNWMRAREGDLSSQLFGDDIQKIKPLLRDDISDSASLDGLLELLVLGGRSTAHAISMLMPQAFQGRPELPQEVRDFYAYHAALVEPWDGPAAVAFSDGRVVGATLDRNGLRPGRWLTTHDGWVVLASETGVFKTADDQVSAKGRLQPGQAVPGRPRGGPRSSRTTRSSSTSRGAAPTASGSATAWCTSRTCRIAARGCRAWSRCGPASSPSAGRRRTCA